MYKKSDSSFASGPGTRKSAKTMSSVMARVIQSLGLTEQFNGWLVVDRWSDIVGPAIARVSSAIKFEDGVLFVAVNDAAWRQELAMKQESLLEKIRSLPYGRTIRQIRLVRGEKGK